MDTMQALMSRISVPPKLLGDPAPEGADLDDGLLHITLVRPEPKVRSRSIEIRERGGHSQSRAVLVD